MFKIVWNPPETLTQIRDKNIWSILCDHKRNGEHRYIITYLLNAQNS